MKSTYSGSGEPAAPRRQSLLRSQARCALLPAATPRVRAIRAWNAAHSNTGHADGASTHRGIPTRATPSVSLLPTPTLQHGATPSVSLLTPTFQHCHADGA